jgi:hypothetical protein
LVPPPEPAGGPIPDDVTDAEIAPVAVETVSAVLYRSHEHETAGLRAQIARLQAEADRQRETLGKRSAQIRQLEGRSRHLEMNAREAWGAYESERGLPVWRVAGRRLRAAIASLGGLRPVRRRSG